VEKHGLLGDSLSGMTKLDADVAEKDPTISELDEVYTKLTFWRKSGYAVRIEPTPA
jgi:hypothetical protein